ncbi:hypothetical protein SCHPADRAFT_893154 [Schizopora paradoxa]|uniref:Uncharacterized protein n=1 Tax=Schizopora paradoxa TaxID=27342 RepID=A0A0H2RC83_9AGAM|nr:hypothetical protein SCHPADRAFT_893154 [Schizopora paradoxa]
MSQPSPSLVGAVVERNAGSSSSRAFVGSATPTGFPSVQHRSKSAFARSRDTNRRATGSVPVVERSAVNKGVEDVVVEKVQENLSGRSTGPTSTLSLAQPDVTPPADGQDDEWRAQMSSENARMVEEMSEEERDKHRVEILDQLGPDVASLIRRARETRQTQSHNEDIAQPVPNRPHAISKFVDGPKGILVSAPASRSTTPGTKLRKLRFADVKPDDIHVFASEPPSPKRTPIALLPPPPPNDDTIVKLSRKSPEMNLIEDIRRRHNGPQASGEEGTPEDIRRRYFPHLPPRDPALEWIEGDSTPSAGSSDAGPELRFDLSGCIIPPEKQETLPTYLGLHHHGVKPNVAGYLLADLYYLARSSVPAQRATILGVLSKIIRRLAHGDVGVEDLAGREDEVRRDALVSGLSALSEKGSLGVQAIDLVWECVVDWDAERIQAVENIELRPVSNHQEEDEDLSSSDPLSSLPFSDLLAQLSKLMLDPSLPIESQSQLLDIVSRLARHSFTIASTICDDNTLTNTLLKMYIQTPIPPIPEGPLPNPRAISVFRSLAAVSRSNARRLLATAEILLRFITTCVPPQDSPFPLELSLGLLKETLDLFTTLAQYGLNCNIATIASEQLGNLSSYLLGPLNTSSALTASWLRLLDIWLVCARDPHRTSPHHDILWSQVQGWGWYEILSSFRTLLSSGRFNAEVAPVVWGAYWGALAAWLEGCRVNSVRSGSSERADVIKIVEETWQEVDESGTSEKTSIQRAITCVRQGLLSVAPFLPGEHRWKHIASNLRYSTSLLAFSRFLLACLSDKDPAPTVLSTVLWMQDTLSQLSSLHSTLLQYLKENVERLKADSKGSENFSGDIVVLRPFSGVLGNIAKLQRIALTNSRGWIPYAVSTLEGLLPGEEEFASWLVQEILKTTDLNSDEEATLSPFLTHSIRPNSDVYVTPSVPTPASIEHTGTLSLPSDALTASKSKRIFGLPLHRDWFVVGLDHVLRSGSSPILSNPDALPASWNSSEADIVCATFNLMKSMRTILVDAKRLDLAMSAEHTTFSCMKVFMLEHEQPQNNSSSEVFRRPAIEALMKEVLLPFTIGNADSSTPSSTHTLEDVSKEFLGPGTPFYQFYTDFVALYDSISFMHPTFARLLLVPTSMRYALDYRKHLWGDFGHLIRTIRTPPNEIISPGLSEFLWPFESDAEMLGWYLRALVKWPLEGFVRIIAVHHVACSIWPDLRQDSGQAVREKRAKMLLTAVVRQAPADVVSEVVRYTQVKGEEVRLAPRCFECDEGRVVSRLQVVGEFGGPQMMSSLEKIFEMR